MCVTVFAFFTYLLTYLIFNVNTRPLICTLLPPRRHRASLGGVNIVALIVQDRWGFRAGWTMMIFDVLIIGAALLVVPVWNVVLSAAGAVVLNLVLALNHRPGRYIGH
mgnify:CR=1 FL=1